MTENNKKKHDTPQVNEKIIREKVNVSDEVSKQPIDEEVNVSDEVSKQPIDKKLKDTEEKLLRSLAEIENQRRRFEKEIKDAFEFGSFNFAKESLAILDNLERAKLAIKNDEKLKTVYKNAHSFVYPSLCEGFGLPILEAMSAGCPVVCSNVSSLPEIAGDAAKYFNPLSTEELFEAIIETVYSPNKLDLLKSKGTNQIKNFSWEKCSNETINTYKTLI